MKTDKNNEYTRPRVDLKEKYYSFQNGSLEQSIKVAGRYKASSEFEDGSEDDFVFEGKDNMYTNRNGHKKDIIGKEIITGKKSHTEDEYNQSDRRNETSYQEEDKEYHEYLQGEKNYCDDLDTEPEFEESYEDFLVGEYKYSNRKRSKKSIEDAYAHLNDKKVMRKEFDILKDYPENDLPIIELYKTYKSYQDNVEAVKDVNFRIDKGEFVFIVGKSGSGKSTLIKLLLREIKPTAGRVYVNGRELTRLHRGKIAKFRRSIGVVFQDFKLLNDRNVYENVAFAQRVIGRPVKEIKRSVPEMLAVVGLSDKHNAFPSELSGGEQQRVALARALINKPAILLADEPTGNLDPKTAWEIMDLLEEINRQGTTVIVVTHNVEIVDAMQKRVIAIHDGTIVSDEQKGGYTYED